MPQALTVRDEATITELKRLADLGPNYYIDPTRTEHVVRPKPVNWIMAQLRADTIREVKTMPGVFMSRTQRYFRVDPADPHFKEEAKEEDLDPPSTVTEEWIFNLYGKGTGYPQQTVKLKLRKQRFKLKHLHTGFSVTRHASNFEGMRKKKVAMELYQIIKPRVEKASNKRR